LVSRPLSLKCYFPVSKFALSNSNLYRYAEEPWCQLTTSADEGGEALLDETWFVDTTVDAAMERVMRRHVVGLYKLNSLDP
jgi:hypothetical protein